MHLWKLYLKCKDVIDKNCFLWGFFFFFFLGINDNKERQKCLEYAEQAGLDVPQITKTVVRNIREKEPNTTEHMTDLSAVTSEVSYITFINVIILILCACIYKMFAGV